MKGTKVYNSKKCPAGANRCGHFNDYVCKCGCKGQCSRVGWCGQGGLYLSTMQVEYSHGCKSKKKANAMLKKKTLKLVKSRKAHKKAVKKMNKKLATIKKKLLKLKKSGNTKKIKALKAKKN